MKTPKPAKTDAELAASLSPPAMYANRFYLSFLDNGARIAFGEVGPDGVARYGAAVRMTPENALALAELIQRCIQKVPAGQGALATAPAAGGGVH